MSEAIKFVVFIDVIFIILLMLSGSFSGYISDIIYFTAFIIPIAIGFYSSENFKRRREEIKGIAEPEEKYLNFSLSGLTRLLPLIAPIVALVFAVSYLTTLLASLVGIEGDAVSNEGILKMLLVHAVAPAFFEEALFRYIPMKLFLPYSKKWCIIYSALFFSLIHCNFTTFPYAFIAGAIFMAIDIALGSVWPSVILHLLNNTASVIWMKYCTSTVPVIIFISVLLILTSVSVLFIVLMRKKYWNTFRGVFDKGENDAISYAPSVLIVICCYIAAMNLVK